MGVIGKLLSLVFGDGRNVVAETAEVFRVNAEQADIRGSEMRAAALAQLAAEFERPRQGWFDRLIDGLNRLPRPAMALGTLALFIAAMTDPVWFSARMQGIALVPEPLWWLLGVVVSFYFGARHQAKGQEFQRSLAATLARTPQIVDNLEELHRLSPARPNMAATRTDSGLEVAAVTPEENAALTAWRNS